MYYESPIRREAKTNEKTCRKREISATRRKPRANDRNRAGRRKGVEEGFEFSCKMQISLLDVSDDAALNPG